MAEIKSSHGYTFKTIPHTNPQRPYRVRCMETLEEKDSALSYDDAISLLVQPMLFAQARHEFNSKDKFYIENVFSILKGKKKSQCDELVKSEIIDRDLVLGGVAIVEETERFQKYKVYKTLYFRITILFENGLMCGCTKIIVEKH